MPPKGGPLSEAQINSLKEWISDGAKWPDGVILVEREPLDPEDLAKESLNLSSIAIYPPKASLTTSADLQRFVGGLAHQESFDPKPYAPSEYRGPFNSIGTKITGARFGPHFKNTAAISDKLVVLNSLTHICNDY